MTKASRYALLIIVLLAAFLLFPWPLWQKLFAIGYGLDPQRPSHSYFLAGMQLPLEARKTGMFGGFLLTYLYMLVLQRSHAGNFPPRSITLVLIMFIACMGIDGLNATLYDMALPNAYAPLLTLRLATGLLTGIAMAAFLLPTLNGILWRDVGAEPSLANGRETLGAVILAGVMFIAVATRPSLLYYPIAILSVAGLVTELTVINTIFVLVLARRVGMACSVRDALPALSGGLIVAVGELAVMSVVRHLTLGSFMGAG